LRAQGDRIPVLILTARDSSNDVVTGLDAGDLRSLAGLHAEILFAVCDLDGRQIAGDALPASAQSHELRTITVPVARSRNTYGSVTVWQFEAWIGGFDRDAALISLGIGALLIALGAMISRRVAGRVLAPLARAALCCRRVARAACAARRTSLGDRSRAAAAAQQRRVSRRLGLDRA
jgi:hypothetical protein